MIPYAIATVMKLKHEIESHEDVASLVGTTLDEKGSDQLQGALNRILPNSIPESAIQGSIVHLAGSFFTKELCSEEAWRIAGNIRRLRAGLSVVPWRRQAADEWVPMQVIDTLPYRTRRNDTGFITSFRVLAGTPCGMILERFWTSRFCFMLAPKLGFSKPWDKYPMQRAGEIMNMRFYGLVERLLSLGKPVFEQMRVSPSLMNHNRRLLKKRMRIGFKCPEDYKHPCFACPVGYDKCVCGIHPRSYIRGECSVCHKVGWIDPIHKELRLCVGCFSKKQLAREKK